MRLFVWSVVVLAVAGCASSGAADWRVTLDDLISVDDAAVRENLLDELLELEPFWADVMGRIDSLRFRDVETPGIPELRMATCIDGVKRPWVIVTPDDYESDMRTPLLVVLHGGVGRAEILPDPLENVAENEFVAMAREHGWIAAVPFGQAGATWFDDVGFANIRALIRTVKREYNVDDDRVWMIGFSDGASAGFFFAMSDPTDYAAIAALNGHMGVASLDFDRASYAPNMAGTPLYATTTFHDGLYPSERMRATIDMARRAGGDVFSLTVQRGTEELVLEGALPEKDNYYIFKRDVPSGAVRARYSANRVDVRQSLVGSFRVFVHPDMFNMDEPVTVAIGDTVLFDELVEPDLEFLLRNFLANRDRSLLYIAELEFVLD